MRGQELDRKVMWHGYLKAQEHVLSRGCLALLISWRAGDQKELDQVQEVAPFRSYVTGQR